MYVVFEYLTYLVLLIVLGGLLFVASVAVLVAGQCAKFIVQSTRRLAVHAAHMASKHFAPRWLASFQPHDNRLQG